MITEDQTDIIMKAEKYDKIKEQRKVSINKYHQTDAGREARKKASDKYYELHKVKILQRKRIRYLKNKQKLEEVLKEISKE
jgi:hypothetical protein